ncbi:uncharacterized protein EAE97_000450 [Botrytis byssoidea]|uniref:C3H1-type domain-containing protein n=1 Tax=Botrytis byssoidea TaxID=139641 RepID=A0A9P5IZ22_9HELO|nr:uncharacterized protein EAE97_000450 [Botrytis byssoidea]KAF7955191.1 hypothetical protein EAE97_000450 [Botrytis byssoidea]
MTTMMDAFVRRFQLLTEQRETGDELIKDLLMYVETVENGLGHENERLKKELNDAHLDLDDSRKSRRELQIHWNLTSQHLERAINENSILQNRNPYIIALVDADGMIFNQDLINQGLEGGKKAANLLRASILEQCSGPQTEEIEIMAKVCGNYTGLSKALMRDGTLESFEKFKEFTLGFTQGKAHFDFIDVGHGKERADSKIKECIRWHLRNWNCKQLLLGISFDSGYAPFLDEVITQDDRNRITIMEGPPIVRELSAIGLRTLKFEHIFRSQKLTDRTTEFSQASVPSTWAGVTSIPPPTPPTTVASPALGKTTSTAVKKPDVTSNVFARLGWVPGPRGLDPPIHVKKDVLEAVKRRTNSNKLCNNHYLRGPCSKGDECCFEHDHNATEEEIKAIAYLTRQNPCVNGQDCDNEECIYGHHCPSVVIPSVGPKEPTCMAFACKFYKDDHPPGTVIKHPKKEYVERY